MVIDVNDLQPLKASEGISFMLLGITTDLSCVPRNTELPILVTLLGIERETKPQSEKEQSPIDNKLFGRLITVNFEQPENAKSSIETSPYGKFIVFNATHPLKAPRHIVFIKPDNSTLIKDLQLENASSPISLTARGIITDVIPLQPEKEALPNLITVYPLTSDGILYDPLCPLGIFVNSHVFSFSLRTFIRGDDEELSTFLFTLGAGVFLVICPPLACAIINDGTSNITIINNTLLIY